MMWKNDFPLFQKHPQLVYLDSAATTLKPTAVIDRLTEFNRYEVANVHRGSYKLSDEATGLFEQSRITVQKFLNAKDSHEVIFTRGTTEGINLVAEGLKDSLKNDDEILITDIEHHANIVPWQRLAQETGAQLKWIELPIDRNPTLQDLQPHLNERTKVFAFTMGSNALGTVPPAKEWSQAAKAMGAVVLIDAAQSITETAIDVQALGCDFLVFSGHKVFAPFGIGVLYGKQESLLRLRPYQLGGSMIKKVTLGQTTYNDLPYLFEAGTPNVEGSICLAEAIKYLQDRGLEKAFAHKKNLTQKAWVGLKELGASVYGPGDLRTSLVGFNLPLVHQSDVGQVFDEMNLAVRVGHLCAQPLMQKLKITGMVRASFSIYNQESDVTALLVAVEKAKSLLS